MQEWLDFTAVVLGVVIGGLIDNWRMTKLMLTHKEESEWAWKCLVDGCDLVVRSNDPLVLNRNIALHAMRHTGAVMPAGLE